MTKNDKKPSKGPFDSFMLYGMVVGIGVGLIASGIFDNTSLIAIGMVAGTLIGALLDAGSKKPRDDDE